MTMTKTGAGDARRLDSSDARSDATARLFLLFAGTQQPPRGGLADLVQTYDSEEAARTAFRQIRLAESSPASWAQLAAVDGQNRTKPLCWFGIGANPDAKVMALPALAEGTVLADPAHRPRASKRTTFLLTALVAMATSTIGFLVDDEGSGPPVRRNTPTVSVVAQRTTSISLPPTWAVSSPADRGADE